MHIKIISVDLDGVLNTYHGNYEPDKIPPISPGAYEFLEKLSKLYNIEIFTVRNKKLVKKWLKENNILLFIKNISNIKNPSSSIIIDDRALRFEGDFQDTYKNIVKFSPHWMC